jgi:hypothetical protein
MRLELYWAIALVLLMRSLLRSSSTDRAIGVFRGAIGYVCKEGVAATKADHAASASTAWPVRISDDSQTALQTLFHTW